MAKASCDAWKFSGTVMAPPETVMVWLRTTWGVLSVAWSGMRSTTTLTLPLPASQLLAETPLKVTVVLPVYPLLSPMMATARWLVLSTEAEIAVLPTCPEVLTRLPVMSAYDRITHQLPLVVQAPLLWVRMPVRLGIMQHTQLPRIALV